MTQDYGFSLEVGQRRERRVQFSRRAYMLIDGLAASVPARIQNLSGSGAYLRAERLPPLGSTFLLRLELGGEETVIRARMQWVDQQWTPDSDIGPGAGVAFLNLGAHEREVLEVAIGFTPTPAPATGTH